MLSMRAPILPPYAEWCWTGPKEAKAAGLHQQFAITEHIGLYDVLDLYSYDEVRGETTAGAHALDAGAEPGPVT